VTEDRAAVLDLLYRYAELIDAGDFEGLGSSSAVIATLSPGTAVGTSPGESPMLKWWGTPRNTC